MYRNEFIEKLPAILRWILIPIASVLSYVIVSMAVNIGGWIVTFLSSDRGGWGINFWTYLISPGLSGWVAVYISAILAPNGKRATAIVLAGVWFLLSGIFAYTSVMTGQWANLIAVVSTAAGCGVALSQIQTDISRQQT